MINPPRPQAPPMHNGPRPSPLGPQPPPPYRAPPPLLHTPTTKPYSKFNVSEPNIMAAQPQPRHGTYNGSGENGLQMQSHLRQMLAATPKHSTLDGQGQNVMLQHLRSSGLPATTDKAYASPDNLRDAANRLFNRNQMDRSSFGGMANTSITQQFNAMQLQQIRASHGHQEDPTKRHSYSNQSFRKAMEQQKVPPQVPPKPGGSRSVSRDDSNTALNDHLDAELKHIMKAGGQRLSMGGGSGATPPLPALSPGPGMLMMPDSNHDSSSPDTRQRPGASKASSRPDLIGEADRSDSKKAVNGHRRTSKDDHHHLVNGGIKDNQRLNMTQGAIDLEKVMASVAGAMNGETSDDLNDDDGEVSTAIDVGDAAAIRKQLDGLENMYGEVLKLLGLRKFGRPAHGHAGGPHFIDTKSGATSLRRHKMYGSMSSLPSVSSIGSRHLYKGQKAGLKASDGQAHKRSSSGGARGERSQNKRFQRLESHVVTLARSVAHLSSEVRSQQMILQEVEALRLEVQQLRQSQGFHAQQLRNSQSFFHNPVSPAHANRVKKLTKFFGDEPPLLRLFLKNLGYEKYAAVFEEAKIGMLELPYLSEDRLEKLGVPMGPRMRILQESRASLQQNMAAPPLSLVNTTAATGGGTEPNNYNVYIL